MSIDPVDSMTVADTKSALQDYSQNIAETARTEDTHQGQETVEDIMEYRFSSNDASVQGFAEAGADKQADQNVLAQFFDGTGSVVNRYI